MTKAQEEREEKRRRKHRHNDRQRHRKKELKKIFNPMGRKGTGRERERELSLIHI